MVFMDICSGRMAYLHRQFFRFSKFFTINISISLGCVTVITVMLCGISNY